MTEEQNANNNMAPLEQNELATLMARAKKMGLKPHHKSGVEKLKGMIADALSGKPRKDEIITVDPMNSGEVKHPTLPKSTGTRPDKRKHAARLIRVHISNMDPNKREWEGAIYTVSNSVVGTFKKYVPFNNEEGWHVPWIMLEMMKERKCQIFNTVKNSRGNKIRVGKVINELSIDTLPPLTTAELKALALKQAMAKGQAA